MDTNTLNERPSLLIKRHYQAPPEKVWHAWTQPEAMKQWFRPEDSFSTPVVEADVRVGGRYRVIMKDSKGESYETSGIYKEVIPNQKLVFTWAWKDTPEHESLVTVIFRPVHGGTEMEFRQEQFFDVQARDEHEQGWTGAFALLERALI